jgi:hypothetical protein
MLDACNLNLLLPATAGLGTSASKTARSALNVFIKSEAVSRRRGREGPELARLGRPPQCNKWSAIYVGKGTSRGRRLNRRSRPIAEVGTRHPVSPKKRQAVDQNRGENIGHLTFCSLCVDRASRAAGLSARTVVILEALADGRTGESFRVGPFRFE